MMDSEELADHADAMADALAEKNYVAPGVVNTLRTLAAEVRELRDLAWRRCVAMAFFRSVIHCGEPWTERCQREYDAAMSARGGGVMDSQLQRAERWSNAMCAQNPAVVPTLIAVDLVDSLAAEVRALRTNDKILRKLAVDLAMGRTRFEHRGDEEWVARQIEAAMVARGEGE